MSISNTKSRSSSRELLTYIVQSFLLSSKKSAIWTIKPSELLITCLIYSVLRFLTVVDYFLYHASSSFCKSKCGSHDKCNAPPFLRTFFEYIYALLAINFFSIRFEVSRHLCFSRFFTAFQNIVDKCILCFANKFSAFHYLHSAVSRREIARTARLKLLCICFTLLYYCQETNRLQE